MDTGGTTDKFRTIQAREATPQRLLAQQYGGGHTRGWVDYLPARYVPWIQLCRLSPPAALFLVYFPNVFGVLHAVTAQRGTSIITSTSTNGSSFDGSSFNCNTASVATTSPAEIVRACVVLFVASFFSSNAAHAWNDLVDAPLDAKVARTRGRPIPRGAISARAAGLFAVSQAACLLAVLRLGLPSPQAHNAVAAALPALLGTAYYPFAKRQSELPQLVLGFCLTWAIMVGSSAVGVASSTLSSPSPWTDPSTLALLSAAVLWVVIFDTIYAHQDVADDQRAGIGSAAVLLLRLRRSRASPLIGRLPFWGLLGAMVAGLVASGYLAGMGAPYYALAVGGPALSVGTMVANVDLDDPKDCWLWFSQGFWATGLAIVAGLGLEYLRRSGGFELRAVFEVM
ncbi:UbiA prenyltransferase family-domain-containing protein [Diaporthe sp. PMI_573]|nr:UbiA prenyltransferase family-domain-containing protein [Diaporthaceae sp. PMI_573]